METDPFGDPLPAGAVARSGTTRLWHATGRSVVESLAFSPDGRLIASAGIELPVVLRDAATGREVRRIGVEPPPPKDPYEPYFRVIGPFAFAPDGECLAVGRASGRIERWELATGRPLPAFDGHGDGVIGLAFSRDGTTLVSGDEGGTVLVRDAANGSGAPPARTRGAPDPPGGTGPLRRRVGPGHHGPEWPGHPLGGGRGPTAPRARTAPVRPLRPAVPGHLARWGDRVGGGRGLAARREMATSRIRARRTWRAATIVVSGFMK
jgi:hypothetical protein